MSVPKPKDRPDYTYWTTPWHQRKKPSPEELEALLAELEEYSRARFVLGRRFKLRKEFYGIPKGTGCTVTRLWPDTRVRWDKWTTKGRGAKRAERTVSFELDTYLEII
jgi:hypothetical protein